MQTDQRQQATPVDSLAHLTALCTAHSRPHQDLVLEQHANIGPTGVLQTDWKLALLFIYQYTADLGSSVLTTWADADENMTWQINLLITDKD